MPCKRIRANIHDSRIIYPNLLRISITLKVQIISWKVCSRAPLYNLLILKIIRSHRRGTIKVCQFKQNKTGRFFSIEGKYRPIWNEDTNLLYVDSLFETMQTSLTEKNVQATRYILDAKLPSGWLAIQVIKNWIQTCLNVINEKKPLIQYHHLCNLSDQIVSSRSSTSIQCNHYQKQKVSITYSLSLFDLHVGLKDISSETVFKRILHEQIVIFLFPSIIKTDRGSQFRSTLVEEFTKLLGVKYLTTSYNPCTKGLVESFHM